MTTASQLLQKTMRCVSLYILFLRFWAELVAGKSLPINSEVRSITEDLLKVLQNYSRVLQTTEYMENLFIPKCNETAFTWSQVSELTDRLIQNQACAEKLQPFSPDGALCPAVLLNQDLLQHLNDSKVAFEDCPSSSFSSPSPDIDILTGSMRCVLCWTQQVAALLT